MPQILPNNRVSSISFEYAISFKRIHISNLLSVLRFIAFRRRWIPCLLFHYFNSSEMKFKHWDVSRTKSSLSLSVVGFLDSYPNLISLQNSMWRALLPSHHTTLTDLSWGKAFEFWHWLLIKAPFSHRPSFEIWDFFLAKRRSNHQTNYKRETRIIYIHITQNEWWIFFI